MVSASTVQAIAIGGHHTLSNLLASSAGLPEGPTFVTFTPDAFEVVVPSVEPASRKSSQPRNCLASQQETVAKHSVKS